jgi:hypothetical protein
MQLRANKSPVERSKTVYCNLRVKPLISWDDHDNRHLSMTWYYSDSSDRVYLGVRLCTKII